MTGQTLSTYWLPKVGIGPAGSMDFVEVPLTDVLNYSRPDGSPQIGIVNLFGCPFGGGTSESTWLKPDPVLQAALDAGEAAQLQSAGVKVVLTIVGNGSFGWGSIPAGQADDFASYLCEKFLSSNTGYGLDGIDIDDEYPPGDTAILPAVQALRKVLPPGKVLSKALFADTWWISQIVPLLDYGAIMDYGDDAAYLEGQFATYVKAGFAPGQVMIGVSAGPVGHGSGFTSIPTAVELARWQPAKAEKMGMMVWSFSQDIQQFTAWPQNQPARMFPNPQDHSWQAAIFAAMADGAPPDPS